jgi:hypothetical protein
MSGERCTDRMNRIIYFIWPGHDLVFSGGKKRYTASLLNPEGGPRMSGLQLASSSMESLFAKAPKAELLPSIFYSGVIDMTTVHQNSHNHDPKAGQYLFYKFNQL